ncbi:hypothetical protein H5410_065069, partial [Solanum commersonii]
AGIIITEDGRAVIEKEQCECEKKSNANRGPTYTVNGIRFTGGENGRRIIGSKRRPIGVRRSEMKSVIASPFSPRIVGIKRTATTTTAKRMPCGGPCRSSSIIVLV